MYTSPVRPKNDPLGILPEESNGDPLGILEKKSSDLSVGSNGQLEQSENSTSQSPLGNDPFDIKGSLTTNKLDNNPLPQTLDEAHTIDNDKSKAVGKNIWNRFLTGIGEMSSGAADLMFQGIQKIMPNDPYSQGKEADLKKFREEGLPTIRTATKDLAGADVTKQQEKNFNDNFWTSAVGGLAQTVPALLGTKGSGFFIQAYDNGLQAMDNSQVGKDLPEGTKTVFGLGVGAAQAAIMKLGLDKIFGKQTTKFATDLAIKTFTDLLSKSKAPITAEVFESALAAAAKGLKETVINGGIKTAKSAATGFLMGAGIDASNQLAETILNKAEGENIFDPLTWGQRFGDVLHAGASTAVGGAIMGAATLPFSKTRSYIAEKVADAKQPADITNLKNELIFKAKDLSPEEAQHLGQTIDDYVRVNAKVPEDVPNRKEVVDKIMEREDIEKTADQKLQELQTVDDAFKPEIQKEVSLLNDKAQEINEEIVTPKEEINVKEKESPEATDEVPVTTEKVSVTDEGLNQNIQPSEEKQSTVVSDNKEKIDDIEKRREKELSNAEILNQKKIESADNSGYSKGTISINKKQFAEAHANRVSGINDKYDKELSELQKQITNKEVIPETKQPELKIEEPPIEPPKEKEVIDDESKKVGVSHKSLTSLTKELGLKEPERGDYIEPKEYAERGRQLLKAGATIEDVGNTSNNLHDRISIARAHLEDLTSIADKAAKEKGIDSNEYQEALTDVEKYSNNTVKQLGTLAHRAMVSLQGERDINTGSFTEVKAALEKKQGSKATPEQDKVISELTSENESLKQRATDLEKKLIEATNESIGKEEKQQKGKYEKSFKQAADTFRKLKTKPFKFKDSEGNEHDVTAAGPTWNSVIELGAKAIEKTGKIADGVAEIIEKVKESDFYKKLSDKDKEGFKDQLTQHFQEAADIKKESAEKANITRLEKKLSDLREGKVKNKAEEREKSQKEIELQNEIQLEKNKEVVKMFADKDGNKFTPDEARTLWEYAKTNYLDKGVNYKDMLSFVSNDTGLSWRQISDAITSPKVKPISDAMYRRQADLRKVQIKVKDYVEKANRSVGMKVLKGVSDLFRGVAVFAHGHIFVGTHAGMTLFDIPRAKYTLKAFFNGFKNAYGNDAAYERRMEELRNEPNYTLAQRAGLQNDPRETNMDEYQKYSKVFGKIGNTGVKGFNAIKILRQDLFDAHFNKLDAAKKADPAVAESIAELVNNATGGTNIKMPKWTQEIAFAANMEAARWEKLTSNPVKATSTALKAIFTPEKASPAERVFAKVWASRVGWEVATYAGLLGINAALQSILNPKNPVNLTNPSEPDYLKFKAGNKDVNMTSGMLSSIQLIGKLGQASVGSQKALKGDTRLQAMGKTGIGYLRGKAAPGAGTLVDFATQTDFAGNTLPISSDKPRTGKHQLTWGEYAWEKAPIPMADAAKNIYEGMHENGLTKPQIEQWFHGLIGFVEAGSTGFKISESYDKQQHSPFTDEDNKKSSFKYFLDKGMELPNTSLSSEVVTDEKNQTKTKVSDFPKDVQEKYQEEHKKQLELELKSILKKNIVYVKTYTDKTGNKINEVSIEKPENGKSERMRVTAIADQNKLAQILRIAQSQATKKTKEKLFPQK